MAENPPGLMKWLDGSLWLKPAGAIDWKPYTALPGLAVKDYPLPEGSKGYATMQRLLKAKWRFPAMVYFVLVSAVGSNVQHLKLVIANSDEQAIELATQNFEDGVYLSSTILMKAPEGTRIEELI